ncbi:efflux RND transporter periplasmic adaptor subunit [Ottowia sp.]|uniref:efflux RND transporter periplasmic adaptor subunit n=1 Tax=Ottowia sp. TaxID=1898956 RepID=UPI0025CBF805|nr:efflux RND transporter periplasmic adaptor subunit [Ottowia sp.]MBK6745274.1 efflux RND transporter periplasmic adaptor subunit [Ottowia sp.]
MTTQRRKLITTLGIAAAFAGVASITASDWGVFGKAVPEAHASQSAREAPATQVDVAAVIAKPITEWQSYSGRLEAVEKVDIRPLVSGRIASVHFKDGALVKKGDVLFTIDPQPYQAEVDQADARLGAVETRAAHAVSESQRADRLLEGNAIARRDYDERQNLARQSAAEVKAARAALQAAKVNLAYTQVVAPVAGRVSRAELTVGNVVSVGAGAPVLTTLVSVTPMYASFNVDEQTYLKHLRNSAKAPVSLGLANETGYSREGTVVSVDNRLDAASGTIRVRAAFDNADGSLVPGLYARVKVGGTKARPAVMVDDSAIGTDQAKKFVLVVDADDKVQYREVTLGNLHEGLRIVESGLSEGERVVVNGVLRVRPGEKVAGKAVNMATLSRGKSA